MSISYNNTERMIKMSVLKITKDNFEVEVLQSTKTVLLDFYADWCGPCRMVSPFVDQIAEENPQHLVGKINVDEQPELAQKFGVMSIPTLILFENGKETKRNVKEETKNAIIKAANIVKFCWIFHISLPLLVRLTKIMK